MTLHETYMRRSVLTAILGFVLLASGSSNASVLSHFVANGAFGNIFSCNADSCIEFEVDRGGSSSAPQTSLFYTLFFSTGAQSFGFGSIPNASLSVLDTHTITLNTDTSTIAGFTNVVCDINLICNPGPGGVISGTWQKIAFFSSRSAFANKVTFGNVFFTSNGTADQVSATVQLTVLGDAFSDVGNIGTNHNTGVTVETK
jgi:hypothetical protein